MLKRFVLFLVVFWEKDLVDFNRRLEEDLIQLSGMAFKHPLLKKEHTIHFNPRQVNSVDQEI